MCVCVCVMQRGDFVPRDPSSSAQHERSSSQEQPSHGAGHFSSQPGHSNRAAGLSIRAETTGYSSAAASSSVGQGSAQQPSRNSASSSSDHTEQSSTGVGRYSSRAGQSPSALHLRESISGLLNPKDSVVQVKIPPVTIHRAVP